MKAVKKHFNKILGFRSKTPWKMIIASLYYVSCVLIFIVLIITPPPVPAGSWDTVVVKISTLIILLWMLSPVVFLSDMPLRDKLPLFKKHTWPDSLIGMIIVFFLFSYLFALSESLHTDIYQVQFKQYIESMYSNFLNANY